MINVTKKTNIYIVCGSTDMRKSINGLSEIVSNKFDKNFNSDICFVFCNKSKNLIKLLKWDINGFWLILKRLEKGRFKWPDNETNLLEVDFSELEILIKAPGVEQKIKRKELFCDYKNN